MFILSTLNSSWQALKRGAKADRIRERRGGGVGIDMHDTEHSNRITEELSAKRKGTRTALRYPQETTAIGGCQLLPRLTTSLCDSLELSQVIFGLRNTGKYRYCSGI